MVSMKKTMSVMPLLLVVLFLTACGGGGTSSSPVSDGEQQEQEVVRNYQGSPIAYVQGDTLYFLDPATGNAVRFAEETEAVFNCVYSDENSMFYYTTVTLGSDMKFKRVNLAEQPVAVETFEVLKQTYFTPGMMGARPRLFYADGYLYLESNYVPFLQAYESFTRVSITAGESVDTIDRFETLQEHPDAEKLGSFNGNAQQNLAPIYAQTDSFDLSEYADDDYDPQYNFISYSADRSWLLFSKWIMFENSQNRGPQFLAASDGGPIFMLKARGFYSNEPPLWCGNSVIYIGGNDEIYITDANGEKNTGIKADYIATQKELRR